VGNYFTMITLPLSFEALLANPKNVLQILNVINDMDELSGGENGSVLLQTSEGTDSAENIVITVKTLLSFTSKNVSIKEIAVDVKNNSDKLKALIGATKATADMASDMNNIANKNSKNEGKEKQE